MRVGILGGTFDPIHIVHMIMGELAADELGLGKVVYVPAGVPPHKGGRLVTRAAHRLEMTRIAVGCRSGFEVSDFEVSRDGPSYTVETVKHLRELFGTGAELYLIVGSDSLSELETWKDWRELVSMVKFAVLPRPNHPVTAGPPLSPGRLARLAPEGLGFDLSSSMIRTRVREGRTIHHLVPESVEEYIVSNALYRAAT